MNARLRIFVSLFLLVLTLGLGMTVAHQPALVSLAGEEAPPYEFFAPIISIPEGGLGTWQVGTSTIEVSRKTTIDTTAGLVQPGNWVWVRAVEEGGQLHARVIRVLGPEEIPPYVDIHGVVLKVRGDIWIISGQQVRVHAKTRILGDLSPQGAVATVRGHMEGTTLVADVILLSSPTDEANRVEFLGRLEEVRGNTWVVDGVKVEVPKDTQPPPLGSLVGVRGQAHDMDRIQAEEVLLQPSPPVFIEGWLVDAGEDKRMWRLLVSQEGQGTGREIQVSVPSNVPVDERAGLARVGARVEVVGHLSSPDRVDATFVHVLEARQTYFTGIVVYIPTDPYAFPWTVENTSPEHPGTVRVWIRPTTVLDRPVSDFRLGDRVAISGLRDKDGIIVARMMSHSKR